MRQLLHIPIHIPIVHGHAEMGAARNKVRRAHVERRGEDAWDKSGRVIAELWQAIEQTFDSLHLDYRKVRLYQDGLPLCGSRKTRSDCPLVGAPSKLNVCLARQDDGDGREHQNDRNHREECR